MRKFILLLLIFLLFGCSNYYPNTLILSGSTNATQNATVGSNTEKWLIDNSYLNNVSDTLTFNESLLNKTINHSIYNLDTPADIYLENLSNVEPPGSAKSNSFLSYYNSNNSWRPYDLFNNNNLFKGNNEFNLNLTVGKELNGQKESLCYFTGARYTGATYMGTNQFSACTGGSCYLLFRSSGSIVGIVSLWKGAGSVSPGTLDVSARVDGVQALNSRIGYGTLPSTTQFGNTSKRNLYQFGQGSILSVYFNPSGSLSTITLIDTCVEVYWDE